MAAADDPSIAGRARGVSISVSMSASIRSGTGALLHQLADDQGGTRRILADEFADQIGARLIAGGGLEHVEHDRVAGARTGERGGLFGHREPGLLDLRLAPRALGRALFGAVDQRERKRLELG